MKPGVITFFLILFSLFARAQNYELSQKLIEDYKKRYGANSLKGKRESFDTMSVKSLVKYLDHNYVNILSGSLVYAFEKGGIGLSTPNKDSMMASIHYSAVMVYACNHYLKRSGVSSPLESYKTGQVLYYMDYYNDAIRAYSHALDNSKGLDQKYVKEALDSRARCKYRIKDFYGSLSDFNTLIKLDKTEVEPYFDVSVIYIELENYTQAIDNLNMFLHYSPKESKGYRNRGIAYIMQDEIERGCTDLSRAGELGDDSVYKIIQKVCGK